MTQLSSALRSIITGLLFGWRDVKLNELVRSIIKLRKGRYSAKGWRKPARLEF